MKTKFPRVRLDGKPPPQPRGRHAKPRDAAAAPAIPIPLPARLGYRVDEFAALTGVSRPTVYRGIRNGTIDVVEVNGIRVIPHTFVVRCGLVKN